jgi:hypothetical protein
VAGSRPAGQEKPGDDQQRDDDRQAATNRPHWGVLAEGTLQELPDVLPVRQRCAAVVGVAESADGTDQTRDGRHLPGRERAGLDAVLESPHRLVIGSVGLDFR